MKPVPLDRSAAPHPDTVSWQTWLGILGINLGALMSALDVTATSAALEDIVGALSASQDDGTWISTAYLIGEIIVIPLTAWLSRVFSTRWYMTACTLLFLLFSILCGNASSLGEMIAFRGLQGFFAGAFVPVAMAYVLRELPPSKHTIGLAIFGLTVTSGPAIGPVLGGWLTDNFSWQYIFYVNLFPGVLMLATCLWLVRPEPVQWGQLRQGDWSGIITMAIGLASLQTVLEEGNRMTWFGSPFIVRLTIVAIVFISLFLWIDLRKRQPFINLRLMQRRNFFLANLINLVAGGGIFGALYLMPVFLAGIQQYSPTQVGLTVMWVGIGCVCIMPLLPWLESRLDARVIVACGVAIYAMSCLVISHLSHQSGTEQLLLPEFIQGVGQGMIVVPLSGLATAGIEADQLADASGLFNQLRNLGGAFASALFATLFSHRSQFHWERLRSHITLADWQTQQRLQETIDYFLSQGADLNTAQQQAITAIATLVKREASVMAIADCYYVLALVMLCSAIALLFIRKPPRGVSMR